jgi:putative hydrolase of the HAD superfamily
MPLKTICSVEVVLFDFGGVLAEEGFLQGLQAIAVKNNLDEEDFIELAHDLIHTTGYLTGKADERAFWDAIRNKTGIESDDAVLRDEILSRFVLRSWMIELVERLKAARVRVGILSDQTDWLEELNRRYDFFRLFDPVFNSYYLGKSKVEASLFSEIAARLERAPKKILFIDDKEAHCERARQRGMNAIHYAGREAFIREMAEYCPGMF